MESDYEMEEEIEEENENASNSDKSGGEEEKDIYKSIFKIIENKNLLSNSDKLYHKINLEIIQIFYYLMQSIKEFHKIFSDKLQNFNDVLNFLEKNSFPNKCVCAGVIDTIPGWRCVECSKYENAIYCNDCYKNSKHLHKDHKVYFLYASGGMCDCGDPDSLSIFCPEHSGPFVDKKQINEYISKTFHKDILDKLTKFFDEFFFKFSKLFILAEKCDLFYNIIFNEKFDNLDEEDFEKAELLKKEREDIIFLKKNFCIVFQNLLHFLRLISKNNLGMLHLIANYLLKSNFENQKLEDDYMTKHKCIKITEDEINIINNDKPHICNCPFLSLLFNNWREEIKSKENENEEFLLSFPHNFPLRNTACVIYFFLYKQILLNNNPDVLYNRHQFFLEDITELIAKKSTLIEESYEIIHDYLKKYIKSPKLRDQYGTLIEENIKKIKTKTQILETDTKYYSKPKMRKIMCNKISIIKRAIDYFCIIHNELEFKSIVPHPQFQNKEMSTTLIEVEIALYGIIKEINMFMDWEKIDIVKEIFQYIIYKILNQKKEGIKQLQNDEYSFHLSLYRCFGLLMNFFCYNHSLNNKCTLIKSVKFVKDNFFNSKDEIESFIQIIFCDYFKFFGFLAGAKNNYFNYYERLNNYPFIYYNDKRTFKNDSTLLKYLFALTDKNFDLNNYLKLSNIEDVYNSFDKLFLSVIEKKEDVYDKELKSKLLLKEYEVLNKLQKERNETFISFQNFLKSQIKPKKNSYEYNCIMQLEFLLELIIGFIKDDSSPYWCLMSFYEETISSQTKRELFNDIKKNENAMKDLENILKEKIIHEITAKNNLIDLLKLKKKLENYLLILFDESYINQIIDELTYNKMQGGTKLFYLKDICLKYLDMNYYLSPIDKSNAQKYIMEFKKDVINLYNNYYYNPSNLTFDLLKIPYEKIFLNKNNINLLIQITQRLLINKDNIGEFDMNSIKNSILPLILNYLSIFSMINTKSFIEFKIENKHIINELYKLFSNYLLNNKNANLLETELQKNIKDVLKQLNYYETIYNNLKQDLSKLNKYDYNTDYVEKLRSGINNPNEKNSKDININNPNVAELNLKKENSKKIRDKLKMKMKAKSNLFLEKSQSCKEFIQEMDISENKKDENITKDEMMCFYCRTPIKLNSYEVSYGKTGFLFKDFFYVNSKKSTLIKEIPKFLENNNINDEIYKNINKGYNNFYEKMEHIISCGHYFHENCFKKGLKGIFNKVFNCPLCLKEQNILIPPLNNFRDKFNFLQSDKISDLLTINVTDIDMQIDIDTTNINKEEKLFKPIVNYFLNSIRFKCDNEEENCNDYILFLQNLFDKYEAYFNFMENIFYIDGTTFHKQQQIDTMQNIILSLRFLVNSNYLNKKQIIRYIKEELFSLSIGTDINEKIISKFENRDYAPKLEKILISLMILYDYEELKDTFKYIIYIFLPYMTCGYYLRYIKGNNYNLDTINEQNFINYLNQNNELMINYFNIFLQKFYFVKIITDTNSTNTNIELQKSFNDLNTEKLLTILNMDTLYKLIRVENNINYLKINEYIPKIFNLNDIFFKLFGNNFDCNKIYNLLISNIKKSDNSRNLTNELIINFSQIKFELINLDNNLFDWIEKTLEKKCCICEKTTKYDYICLTCGNKTCHTKSCNKFDHHIKNCSGNNSIFIDMDDMRAILLTINKDSKILFPLYVNKNGVGPNGYEIGNEFKLSQEKIKLVLKNYVCNDFIIN